MIQIDLSVLVTMFYMLGEKNLFPDYETSKVYNALDQWQKNELNRSWQKGFADAGHTA